MRIKRRIRLIKAFLLIVMAVCLFRSVQSYRLLKEHEKEREALKERLLAEEDETVEETEENEYVADITEATQLSENMTVVSQSNTAGQNIDLFENPLSEDSLTDTSTVMLKRYESLYEENHDLVGWLSVEGMTIDYPVMQNEDMDYYLHHDFYGKEDRYGCLFVKEIADVDTPGTNFVIYGHNMRDGAMFGDLDLYRDESFYREHPIISFDTLYEERTYEIVAVFKSRVYKSDDDAFKYYQFYDASTEEEFDYFYDNIKELSFYDTGVTAEFGDTFLTLSTCAYHVDDGRLAVVAKRLTE